MTVRGPTGRIAGLLALVAAVMASAGCEGGGAEPPNVVLIDVDTLRADHLGYAGGPVPTPRIDALARSGVVFERAYAHAPLTLPSHASLFTGLLPGEHGVASNRDRLSEEHETLAERLRAASYQTAAFVSLGVLRASSGFAQGFETYADDFSGGWWIPAREINERVLPWLARPHPRPFLLWIHYSDPHEPYIAPGGAASRWQVEVNGMAAGGFQPDGRPVRTRIRLRPGPNRVAFVREPGSSQAIWFRDLRVGDLDLHPGPGWVKRSVSPHYLWEDDAPREHDPTGRILYAGETSDRVSLTLTLPGGAERAVALYLVPEVFHRSAEEQRTAYAQEVRHLDAEVGRLLDALARVTPRRRTLVAFTADHGEMLGTPRGCFGHGRALHESLVRVPLVLSLPGTLEAGSIVRQPVRHADLARTIEALVGLPTPGGEARGPLFQPASGAILSAHEGRRAVWLGPYKYVQRDGDRPPVLYDLERDPGETRDVASDRPEITRRARALLERVPEPPGGAAAPVSEEDLEMLRSLGYAE